MPLFYRVDDQGGFVCGDSDSRITVYAYPTSENAQKAARGRAWIVATQMLAHETFWRRSGAIQPPAGDTVAEYDNRNWTKLQIRSQRLI